MKKLVFIMFVFLLGACVTHEAPSSDLTMVVFDIENDRTLKIQFEDGSDDRIEKIMFRLTRYSSELRDVSDVDDQAAYNRLVESYDRDVSYFIDLSDVFVSNQSPDVIHLTGEDGYAISVYISDDFKSTAQRSSLDVGYALTIMVDFSRGFDVFSMASVLSFVGIESNLGNENYLSFKEISGLSDFMFFDVIQEGVRVELKY